MRPNRHIVNSFTRSKPWVFGSAGNPALKGRQIFCRPGLKSGAASRPILISLTNEISPTRSRDLNFRRTKSGSTIPTEVTV